MSDSIRITEIYHSIQGESSYAGLPCIFVRTTGCNLRCTWCDTEYSFHGGQSKTIDEIITQVETYNCKLVEITGGEPLLQKQVPELAKRLLDLNYTVLVETSGERDISVLDECIVKVMDLKCPGSGECERNRWENIEHLTLQDEVKFVLKDRVDYDWSVSIIRKYDLDAKAKLIFSPVFGEIDLIELSNWMIEDCLSVRLQVQMHKIIWPPETKSV